MAKLSIAGKVSANIGGKTKLFTPNTSKTDITEALDINF